MTDAETDLRNKDGSYLYFRRLECDFVSDVTAGDGAVSNWHVSKLQYQKANTAPAPRMLTVSRAFGERNNRLAVTIKDMSQADMGMGMGMSAFPRPCYGLGAGLKALGMNAGGLSVDVQLTLDMDVPNAYLAVTEYSGSALAGCDAASYGPILSDSSERERERERRGFGMGANIMSSQQQMNAAGIVKMVDIQRDSVQNIQATMAPEFTIDSLAGRGFVDSEDMEICLGAMERFLELKNKFGQLAQFGHFGGGHGAFGPGAGGAGGLEMVVEIYSDSVPDSGYGKPIFIAITKYAGKDPYSGVCTPESVGPVFSGDPHGIGHGGGFPLTPNFALHGLPGVPGGAGGYGGEVPLPEGVVAEVEISKSQPATININSLGSIVKLDQIAGRGVVACTKFEKNYLGEFVCTGDLLSCTGLTYEMVPEKKHHDDSGTGLYRRAV
nr:hypothetical protein BaRGS_023474 [Batillaria attramentaria]